MKKLSDLGERKAIYLISKIFMQKEVAVGIGDDCAALDFGEKYLLISTDMISQKTHILKEMTPFQIGWFIVTINLSDIAAKGGIPLGLVLSFGLPRETSEDFLKKLAEGANSCATTYNTSIIGGDIKESSEINLCGTAFGIVEKDKFMPRKGAKPNDIVAVTGSLGKAGAGYYSLKNKTHNTKFSKLLFEPKPKIKEGKLLSNLNCVTSCMDISDGLSSSLYQLQEINNTGFEINIKDLPISTELIELQKKQKELDTQKIALHFGGDYELLVTLPKNKYKQTKEMLKKIGGELFVIGKVTADKKINIYDGTIRKTLLNLGYEHFKNHVF
jgi:thiamine-monophosphate kinase